MTKNRSYSIAFKRQVAEEYLAGAASSVLGKRHDLCRNLVRIWVRKYEAGEYDDDARAADTLQEFEAKVAALEQLVGRQALEIEFLKKAVKSARLPNGAPTSAITGPPASPSRGGVR
jgi:transposase-like protein